MVVLEAGTIIDRNVRLVRLLGRGGMGVVWAARHLELDADVAVKFIHPERASLEPELARFKREARTTARIVHPNVVRVMDYGTVDGTFPFLVMELLVGFTLAEFFERGGRMSLATTARLVEQLTCALDAAASYGVVHRDIKPQNIMIANADRESALSVKVLDFGVAKVVREHDGQELHPPFTHTGVVVGSPPYMSPEQLEGRRNLDIRCDLWSVAVVTYEALTGELPFRGESFVSLGAAVLKGEYRPVTFHRPDLPASLDDWFAKALCVEPSGRFTSGDEMASALSMAASLAPASAEVNAPSRPPEAAISLVTAPHAPPLQPRQFTSNEPLGIRRWPKPAIAWTGFGAAAAATYLIVAQSRGIAAPVCPTGAIFIDGRSFEMGSVADGETPSDEVPRHSVHVDGFCLDQTEVTVRAYERCTKCPRLPGTVDVEGITPNGRAVWSAFCTGERELDHPVNCVTWAEAEAYCQFVGMRLPTEIEWEYAARGADGRAFPWGNQTPDSSRTNACGSECSRALTERLHVAGTGGWPAMYAGDDGAVATEVVGARANGRSPFGISDLAGNVWEWTSSRYCPYGQEGCGDSRHVLRGGGWDTVDALYLRSTHRRPSSTTARGWSIGFRCASTP